MVNDNFALTGALTISLNNEVVQETKNLVVTDGKNWVASRLKDTGTSPAHTIKAEMSHMAIGTETSTIAADPVVAGDIKLGTELDRNVLTVDGGTVSGASIEYACTWAAGDGTGAITEAGIFNHATKDHANEDMFARTKFAVVNKGALDSMTITWTITVS
jgi:hypothetical protein